MVSGKEGIADQAGRRSDSRLNLLQSQVVRPTTIDLRSEFQAWASSGRCSRMILEPSGVAFTD